MKLDVHLDDDEIKVGVIFESEQSGNARLISVLDGIVTRMRMNFNGVYHYRRKKILFYYGDDIEHFVSLSTGLRMEAGRTWLVELRLSW